MRALYILILITLGLPIACNPCGAGRGPKINYEMINQSIENTQIDILQETSSVLLSFSIRYEDQQVAMIQKTSSSFGAFACSPPPVYFMDTITDISITSNTDLYEFAAGEELISLFVRSEFGANESLTFPIQLQVFEQIQLIMAGPIPDNPNQIFTIKSKTSDGKEFESMLTVSFQ